MLTTMTDAGFTIPWNGCQRASVQSGGQIQLVNGVSDGKGFAYIDQPIGGCQMVCVRGGS